MELYQDLVVLGGRFLCLRELQQIRWPVSLIAIVEGVAPVF
jgi:hypothetical protein